MTPWQSSDGDGCGRQGQYWSRSGEPYAFVPVSAFASAYWQSSTGKAVGAYLENPRDDGESHAGMLSKDKYFLPQGKILRACLRRELTLMSRNRWPPLH